MLGLSNLLSPRRWEFIRRKRVSRSWIWLVDEIDRFSATIVCRYGEDNEEDPSPPRLCALYITEIETFPYYYERGHRLIRRYYKPRPRSTNIHSERVGDVGRGPLDTPRDGYRLCSNRAMNTLCSSTPPFLLCKHAYEYIYIWLWGLARRRKYGLIHIYVYIYSVILSRNTEFLDKNNTQFPPPSGPDDA